MQFQVQGIVMQDTSHQYHSMTHLAGKLSLPFQLSCIPDYSWMYKFHWSPVVQNIQYVHEMDRTTKDREELNGENENDEGMIN